MPPGLLEMLHTAREDERKRERGEKRGESRRGLKAPRRACETCVAGLAHCGRRARALSSSVVVVLLVAWALGLAPVLLSAQRTENPTPYEFAQVASCRLRPCFPLPGLARSLTQTVSALSQIKLKSLMERIHPCKDSQSQGYTTPRLQDRFAVNILRPARNTLSLRIQMQSLLTWCLTGAGAWRRRESSLTVRTGCWPFAK